MGDALGRGVLESSVVGLSRPYCERLNAASRGRACEVPIQWSWRSSFLLTLFAGLGYPLRKLAVRFASGESLERLCRLAVRGRLSPPPIRRRWANRSPTPVEEPFGGRATFRRKEHANPLPALSDYWDIGTVLSGADSGVRGEPTGEARTGSGSREGSEGAASTGASGADVGTGGTASVDLVGDESGQTREVEFASISAGTFHTCGVMVDGFVACWGDDYFGQSTTPAGKFAAVSAAHQHTCGLRATAQSPAGAVMNMASPRNQPGSSPPSARGSTTPAG